MKARATPVYLTHRQRKRLWWWAQRMSFAAAKLRPESFGMARREYCKFVYRVLIRHPEEHLRGA